MQLFGHPLKLVILDVDGVILDLMAGFAPHLEAAAGQLHLPIEPIRAYLAAVHYGARQSYANLPEAIQAWWPSLSPCDRRHFVEYFRTIERVHPYPPVEGSLETIHWFRRQQIPVALCTTNDRQTLTYRLHSAGMDPGWFAAASTWESGPPQARPQSPRPHLHGDTSADGSTPSTSGIGTRMSTPPAGAGCGSSPSSRAASRDTPSCGRASRRTTSSRASKICWASCRRRKHRRADVSVRDPCHAPVAPLHLPPPPSMPPHDDFPSFVRC